MMNERSKKGGSFSYRASQDHGRRLQDLIEATEHDRSFFLTKALERSLPELEKRYENDLRALRARRAALNDAGGSGAYPAHRSGATALTDDTVNSRPGSSGTGGTLPPAVEELLPDLVGGKATAPTPRAPRRKAPAKTRRAAPGAKH